MRILLNVLSLDTPTADAAAERLAQDAAKPKPISAQATRELVTPFVPRRFKWDKRAVDTKAAPLLPHGETV